jgi:hypothetical protein
MRPTATPGRREGHGNARRPADAHAAPVPLAVVELALIHVPSLPPELPLPVELRLPRHGGQPFRPPPPPPAPPPPPRPPRPRVAPPPARGNIARARARARLVADPRALKELARVLLESPIPVRQPIFPLPLPAPAPAAQPAAQPAALQQTRAEAVRCGAVRSGARSVALGGTVNAVSVPFQRLPCGPSKYFSFVRGSAKVGFDSSAVTCAPTAPRLDAAAPRGVLAWLRLGRPAGATRWRWWREQGRPPRRYARPRRVWP